MLTLNTSNPLPPLPRLFHVWVERSDTKRKVRLSGYAMPHDQACTFKDKQTPRKEARYYLEQVGGRRA